MVITSPPCTCSNAISRCCAARSARMELEPTEPSERISQKTLWEPVWLFYLKVLHSLRSCYALSLAGPPEDCPADEARLAGPADRGHGEHPVDQASRILVSATARIKAGKVGGRSTKPIKRVSSQRP
jgi:hypothetical protein